jgi:hypothetical protein
LALFPLLSVIPVIWSRGWGGPGVVGAVWWVVVAFPVLRTLLLAAVAMRGLAEARASGWLELVLGTPWPRERLARDYLVALRGLWLAPMLVAIGLDSLQVGMMWVSWGASPKTYMVFLAGREGLRLISGYLQAVAACWLAAALAVEESRSGRVLWRTVLWVNVIPWLLQLICSLGLRALGLFLMSDVWNLGQALFFWMPSMLPGVYAVGLMVWSRRRLVSGLVRPGGGTLARAQET